MAIQFTSAQKRAVEHRGCNLLISAGAGSGKTAVLTERIIRMVEEGIPIDKLVVLTFTNAAALEMKSRIRKTLMKRHQSPAVLEALETIDNAHIRTFDSYTLYLLKTYGHLAHIEPNIRIGDPVEIHAMTEMILNRVLKAYYENPTDAFKAYVETFETKDDKTIKSHIRFFHEMLMLSGDFSHSLQTLGPAFYSDDNFERLFALYENFIMTVHKAFSETIHALNAYTHYPKVEAFVGALHDTYGAFLRARDYDALVQALMGVERHPNSGAATREINLEGTAEEQAAFKIIIKQVKDLLDKHLTPMLDKPKVKQRDAFMKSKQHIAIVQQLLEDYDAELMKHQSKNGIMHYASVARLTIDLLKRHESLQATLKENIKALLVDEYQDTNTLQETLIDLITENNVTMVGDVKQSIYRFRNAEPSLFIKKRLKYLNNPKQGTVIDMNENFRSREEVINDINTVFSTLMDRDVGGVDYDDTQKLVTGNKAFASFDDHTTPYGLHFPLMDKEALDAIKENSGLLPLEMEIFVIAKMIKDAVGTWHVKDVDGLRPAEYRDFVLLFEVKTNYDMVESIFYHEGIPLAINKDEPFIKYHDIDVARHLLNAVHALSDDDIYHQTFKHAFLGLARSFLYDYDDDAILKQTLQLPKTRASLLNMVAVEPAFEPLFHPLIEAANTVKTTSVDTVFTTLVHKTSLLSRIVKLPHTAQALKRIESLITTLKTLSNDGYTLHDVTQYFDHLIEAKLDVEFATAHNEGLNAVSMMTIHKSKGLEFPFVIIPHTSRDLNVGNKRAEQFDRSLGIMIDHVDEGRTTAFVHQLKKMREKKDDISERLRVLYVALTRAEEACIVPLLDGDYKNFRRDAKGKILTFDREYRMKSFADCLEPFVINQAINTHQVDLTSIPYTLDYTVQDKTWEDTSKQRTMKTYEPFSFPGKTKTKQAFSHGVDALLSKKDYEALSLGNTMHELFESIDFTQPVQPQIVRLTTDEKEQAYLKQFFDSDIMQSLDIVEVYKEFPFYIEDDAQASQGYIDLIIETKTHMMLIDYKLKYIDHDYYESQVRNYASILRRLTNKPIKGYLYSIVDGEFKPVSIERKA